MLLKLYNYINDPKTNNPIPWTATEAYLAYCQKLSDKKIGTR